MSSGTSAGEPGTGDALDWLHAQGRRRSQEVPEFDVEKTLDRVRAAREAAGAALAAGAGAATASDAGARLRERPGAVSFWHALSPTEQAAFAAAARERVFPPGAVLMREGGRADDVIVILEGWTKICVSEGDRERVVAERGPGQLVGERGAVPGGLRSATVIALEMVRALVVTTGDFAAFVAEHPGVPDLVDKQVYDRLTEMP
jgi:hypothetical protein